MSIRPLESELYGTRLAIYRKVSQPFAPPDDLRLVEISGQQSAKPQPRSSPSAWQLVFFF